MKKLINTATNAFKNEFTKAPEFFFQAPGRVNLIGEHTDYNQGFVLPCAIDRGTVLAISPRNDDTVRVVAADHSNAASEWAINQPVEKVVENGWSNYLRGVCEQFLLQKKNIKGMNIVAIGNIPQGAGLSSSASFSVAFAVAINDLNGFGLSPAELALICQASENQFVGCQCGIMDQLISAAGQEQKALLIDCSDISYRAIELPGDATIVIIDSKVTRGLVSSEYNTRRKQCEQAAKIMGLSSLRQASMDLLENAKSKMDEAVYRRARHIITENERTLAAAEALKNGNYAALSQLMAGSHLSMRDDFEITVPQVDLLVEQVDAIIGEQGGVRMTGGGFGGCVVALTKSEQASDITHKIGDFYTSKTGLVAEFHLCKASAGAGRVYPL